MNNKSIWNSNLIKVIAIPLALVAVAAIWYGVFSVTTKFTEDSLRGVVVATAYILGLAFFARWIFYAVSNKDRGLFLFSAVLTTIYLVVGGGMLWLNGQIKTDVLKQGDYRITWVMQNVVWIPAVLTGLLAYLMMVYNKQNKGTELPADITILEGLVIFFAVVGSAWGTIDAYIGLTGDAMGAFWLAGVTELALLGFMVWSLRANDEYSFWGATCIAIGYFGIAMTFQLLDGGIRAGNLDTNTELQDFARNLVWVMPVITIGLGIALAVVDAAVNGSSWLKGTAVNERPVVRPVMRHEEPEMRVERPARPQLSHGSNRPPERYTSPNRPPQKQMQPAGDGNPPGIPLAERRLKQKPPKGEGGDPKKVTDSMRWGLNNKGYSDTDIDEMTPEAAFEKLTGRPLDIKHDDVPPAYRKVMSSKNGNGADVNP